jgi:hypothetical protein
MSAQIDSIDVMSNILQPTNFDFESNTHLSDIESDFGGAASKARGYADHSFESSFTLSSNLKYLCILIKIQLRKFQQERSFIDHLQAAFSTCRDFIYLVQYFKNPRNIAEKGLRLMEMIL